jgi:hypothetical protein
VSTLEDFIGTTGENHTLENLADKRKSMDHPEAS